MRPTESKLVRHRKMTIVDSDSGANDHEAPGSRTGSPSQGFHPFYPILHHPVTIIITGLSILMDGRSKFSLMVKNCGQTRKAETKQSHPSRTSFVAQLAQLFDSMQCRPGGANRHTHR